MNNSTIILLLLLVLFIEKNLKYYYSHVTKLLKIGDKIEILNYHFNTIMIIRFSNDF